MDGVCCLLCFLLFSFVFFSQYLFSFVFCFSILFCYVHFICLFHAICLFVCMTHFFFISIDRFLFVFTLPKKILLPKDGRRYRYPARGG